MQTIFVRKSPPPHTLRPDQVFNGFFLKTFQTAGVLCVALLSWNLLCELTDLLASVSRVLDSETCATTAQLYVQEKGGSVTDTVGSLN